MNELANFLFQKGNPESRQRYIDIDVRTVLSRQVEGFVEGRYRSGDIAAEPRWRIGARYLVAGVRWTMGPEPPGKGLWIAMCTKRVRLWTAAPRTWGCCGQPAPVPCESGAATCGRRGYPVDK